MNDIVERGRGCPVMHYDYAAIRPAGSYQEKAIELRDNGAPIWVNTLAQGFWVVTTQELVREVYLKADIFTTDSVMAVEPETNPSHVLLPLNVNPPEHRKYRSLLAPWFSPDAVTGYEPIMRSTCRRLVEGFASRGSVEIAYEYAARVPTENLLQVANMSLELATPLIGAVDAFTRGFSGLESTETGATSGMDSAVDAIHDVTNRMIADRRANPQDPKTDLFTYLTTATVDERSLTDDEIRAIGLIYVVGGMETTRAQLGWLIYHMAKVPEDRRRVLADPTLLPLAIEEVIRYYTVIWGIGRKVGIDINWHGVELRKGDMVYAMNGTVNRDPKRFTDPDSFQLDRKMTPHYSFGLGAHSCIGMHVARAQLRIAFEEFHRLIPEYTIKADAVLRERGSEVTIQSLPLIFDPVRAA
ncbi:MAG: cytochrome P450 [Dehalococcoidia bacterium]